MINKLKKQIEDEIVNIKDDMKIFTDIESEIESAIGTFEQVLTMIEKLQKEST